MVRLFLLGSNMQLMNDTKVLFPEHLRFNFTIIGSKVLKSNTLIYAAYSDNLAGGFEIFSRLAHMWLSVEVC